MASRPPTEFSREDVLDNLIPTVPADPNTLEWEPLIGILRNSLRLGMNMTEATLSEEMLRAFQTSRYPEADVPEIRGLIRGLEAACSRAAVPLRLERGPRELQSGLIAAFVPVRIHLRFERATLLLAIAPGEFQWILKDARKERGSAAAQVDALRRALLEETRTWVRNGNR